MTWLTQLLDEYCEMREQHKSSLLNTIKNYMPRVLWSEKSSAKAYSNLAKNDLEFFRRASEFVRQSTRDTEVSELKYMAEYLDSHIAILEERSHFVVLYSVLATSLITIYFAAGEVLFASALILFSLPLIVERMRANARIFAVKELLNHIRLEVKERALGPA
jgi:hypothetical protein